MFQKTSILQLIWSEWKLTQTWIGSVSYQKTCRLPTFFMWRIFWLIVQKDPNSYNIFCSYKRWPVVNINFKTKNQYNEMFHLMSEFQCWWNIHRGASYTWTWYSKDILRRGWGPTTASNVQKVEKKVWLWNLRGLHKVRDIFWWRETLSDFVILFGTLMEFPYPPLSLSTF